MIISPILQDLKKVAHTPLVDASAFAASIIETSIIGSLLIGNAETKVKKLLEDAVLIEPLDMLNPKLILKTAKVIAGTNIGRDLIASLVVRKLLQSLGVSSQFFDSCVKLLQNLAAAGPEKEIEFAVELVTNSEVGAMIYGTIEEKSRKVIEDAKKIEPLNFLDPKAFVKNVKVFASTNLASDLGRRAMLKELAQSISLEPAHFESVLQTLQQLIPEDIRDDAFLASVVGPAVDTLGEFYSGTMEEKARKIIDDAKSVRSLDFSSPKRMPFNVKTLASSNFVQNFLEAKVIKGLLEGFGLDIESFSEIVRILKELSCLETDEALIVAHELAEREDIRSKMNGSLEDNIIKLLSDAKTGLFMTRYSTNDFLLLTHYVLQSRLLT